MIFVLITLLKKFLKQILQCCLWELLIRNTSTKNFRHVNLCETYFSRDSDTTQFEVHLGITKLPSSQGNGTSYDGLAENGTAILKLKRTIKHSRFSQIPFTLHDICLLEFASAVNESGGSANERFIYISHEC